MNKENIPTETGNGDNTKDDQYTVGNVIDLLTQVCDLAGVGQRELWFHGSHRQLSELSGGFADSNPREEISILGDQSGTAAVGLGRAERIQYTVAIRDRPWISSARDRTFGEELSWSAKQDCICLMSQSRGAPRTRNVTPSIGRGLSVAHALLPSHRPLQVSLNLPDMWLPSCQGSSSTRYEVCECLSLKYKTHQNIRLFFYLFFIQSSNLYTNSFICA